MAMFLEREGPGDGRSNPHLARRDFQRINEVTMDGSYENRGAELDDGYDAPLPTTPESRYDAINMNSEITEEELMFKLRHAHLNPEFDWHRAISTVNRQTGKTKVFDDVLSSLREYPLPIRQKLALREVIGRKIQMEETPVRGRRLSVKKIIDQKKNIKKTARGSIGMINNGFVPFDLWANAIGRIAAYFGTNVASYFRFLRFLVLLNIAVCLIMFCFVSLPQIIPRDVINDDVKSGFFGLLSNTIFFYGAYSNTTLGNHEEDDTVQYNRPLAYLTTWSCVNILAILVIVISMYVNYRQIKQSHEGKDEVYSSQLLTGWDFSVTSADGVRIWSLAIATYFKEAKRDDQDKNDLTIKQRVALLCLRLLCNLISIGILGGSCYLIYYVAQNTIKPGLDIPSVISDFFVKYQLTFIVAGLKVFIPRFLSFLLVFERYHPRTQIKLQIARTAVFYVASLVVFLASIYAISTQCVGKLNSENNSTSSGNTTTQQVYQEAYCCWENEVGEQLFQVVILDLAVSLVVGLVTSGGKTALTKCLNFKKFGESNFDVADLILDLVYGQSLIWLGLYFAPFFGAVALVKLFLLFYFNYAIAVYLCVPTNNVFKASRSGTFYMFILLITLFVCLFPMTYAIIKFEPSVSCGPFRTRDRVYHVLTREIGDSPSWLQDIINYASTPLVIVPLLIVLILVIVYYKARSATQKSEAKELRNHLQFERKVEKRKIFARAKLNHGISASSGLNDPPTRGPLLSRGRSDAPSDADGAYGRDGRPQQVLRSSMDRINEDPAAERASLPDRHGATDNHRPFSGHLSVDNGHPLMDNGLSGQRDRNPLFNGRGWADETPLRPMDTGVPGGRQWSYREKNSSDRDSARVSREQSSVERSTSFNGGIRGSGGRYSGGEQRPWEDRRPEAGRMEMGRRMNGDAPMDVNMPRAMNSGGYMPRNGQSFQDDPW
ncbi:unnamed protein product [Lymnaea stagnalis]|uniref:TMC domain-containing protein n=1 Tax=Lymnaea stagnalis TaxID=6523 RepID=A0AAV2HIT8_LYMST